MGYVQVGSVYISHTHGCLSAEVSQRRSFRRPRTTESPHKDNISARANVKNATTKGVAWESSGPLIVVHLWAFNSVYRCVMPGRAIKAGSAREGQKTADDRLGVRSPLIGNFSPASCD